MMLGDDIQKHRQKAEEDASGFDVLGNEYNAARAVLALFICAEQLYEVRANLALLIEQGITLKEGQ